MSPRSCDVVLADCSVGLTSGPNGIPARITRRGSTAFALVVGEVEVVILVRISSEGGVVLARCQGQRSPAFPPSNQPSAKENGIYSQSTGRAKNEVVELGD